MGTKWQPEKERTGLKEKIHTMSTRKNMGFKSFKYRSKEIYESAFKR